jgi:single-stranded DNA-binding protein
LIAVGDSVQKRLLTLHKGATAAVTGTLKASPWLGSNGGTRVQFVLTVHEILSVHDVPRRGREIEKMGRTDGVATPVIDDDPSAGGEFHDDTFLTRSTPWHDHPK